MKRYSFKPTPNNILKVLFIGISGISFFGSVNHPHALGVAVISGIAAYVMNFER